MNTGTCVCVCFHFIIQKGHVCFYMLVFNIVTDTRFNSSNRGVNCAELSTINNETSGLPGRSARYSHTHQIEEFTGKARKVIKMVPQACDWQEIPVDFGPLVLMRECRPTLTG